MRHAIRTAGRPYENDVRALDNLNNVL